jgi:hypothetical protein
MGQEHPLMALKLILGAICLLAALAEFSHNRWITKNFCTCGECKKASQLKPFNRIVGTAAIVTIILAAIPSSIPLVFYAGFKFQTFVSNWTARKMLA